MTMDFKVRQVLQAGVVIPAHPLALNARRRLDERRQRALSRYYLAAGAGGLAVGVHTTQFAIRDKRFDLLAPVLTLAMLEVRRAESRLKRPVVCIGGICGKTRQAVREAMLLADLGYHAGLLSLAALSRESQDALISHCQTISQIIPIIGFYLQPAVGGRVLPYSFWRRLAELPNLVAVKVAPFNRYQTLDVVRAVMESGRQDIVLYTGNDDNIVLDLLTPWRFQVGNKMKTGRIHGGLLGHWSVWTKKAVWLFEQCQRAVRGRQPITPELLRLAMEVTDCNAAFFDAANGFGGCIAGLHEVLCRQGLLEGIWCLDPRETLGPGQMQAIDRVYQAYPHLNDDAFVAAHRDQWLAD